MGQIVSAQPQSGVLGLGNLDATARTLIDFANSPMFKMATEAVSRANEIRSQLNNIVGPSVIEFSKTAKIISEPLNRLSSELATLQKEYQFPVTTIPSSLTSIPWIESDFTSFPEVKISRVEVKAALLSLGDKIDDVKQEIILEVGEQIQKQFDKFVKSDNIKSEPHEKLLYCKFCDTQLFKVMDFTSFILAVRTHKCPNKDCKRLLQIPADLKIKDL